jgi:signal transduction histidine kinase
MNILTNAAQAIKGNGTIGISIRRKEANVVRVEISDTGVGIPKEHLGKITDPFFTTKDVGEGTGLGLWISDSIVRAHGGSISCTSSPSDGTVFAVEIPIRPPQDPQ